MIRNLLAENISIRDISTILDTLADYGPKFKDPETLTEFVRQSLSRQISRRYLNPDGKLVCIGFSPPAPCPDVGLPVAALPSAAASPVAS